MALEIVINEHSLRKASNVATARKWMDQFLQTLKKVAQYGDIRQLHMEISTNFRNTSLAPDYPFLKWFNEKPKDDLRLYLMTLITKGAFFGNNSSGLDGEVSGYKFSHPDPAGPEHTYSEICGLWVSHFLKAIALSLPSNECWDSESLDLNIKWKEEDENGAINEKKETVRVIHASRPEHVCKHVKWIEKRLRDDIKNGNDLWNRKGKLFPSLTFCDDVKRQVQCLSPTEILSVFNRLYDLETHCQGWKDGRFIRGNLRGRPRSESEATLNEYGKERTFLCPDEEYRVFSWHIDVSIDNWRLHFFPTEPGKITIGYVGPHLRTATG